VLAAEHALKPALAEWTDARCNALADRDDIHAITRRINGGYTNFAERVRWLHVVKPLIDCVDLKTAAPIRPKPPVPAEPAGGSKATARHVGAGGAVVAAFGAAWHALDRAAPWWVVAGLAAVGVTAAAHILQHKGLQPGKDA
jgi:hypothetical protein